jgi:trk system potassium uptake protein TrkH
VIVTVFMILAGSNFSLIFTALSGKLGKVAKDSEFRAYLFVFLAAAGLVAFDLARSGVFPAGASYGNRPSRRPASSRPPVSPPQTSTYGRAFSRVVLLGLMLIGGCAGSTGGGIKVARYLVLFKQAAVELKYLVFPRGVFTVRVNGEPFRKMAIFERGVLLFMYMMAAAACVLAVAATGASLETSLTASLASIGNIGPGLGSVGPSGNYAFFPGAVKLILSFAMLAGRLELYTVFVLFSSAYRRR